MCLGQISVSAGESEEARQEGRMISFGKIPFTLLCLCYSKLMLGESPSDLTLEIMHAGTV